MSKILNGIILSEEKKLRILEEGKRLANQRQARKKMRNVIVVAVCLFGITSWYFNMDFETVGSYPIRVYAQELSEDNEIDLRENSKFTLRKTKTPLGLGYELYSLVEKGYSCKIVNDQRDEGEDTIFTGENYIYWIPDYWKEHDVKIYDDSGNVLKREISGNTTNITYCVYDEQGNLQVQMTVALQEIDEVGKGEIIELISYPKLEEE